MRETRQVIGNDPSNEPETAFANNPRLGVFLFGLSAFGTAFRFLLGYFQNPLASLSGSMQQLWEHASPDQFLNPTSFLQGLEPVGSQFYLLLLRMLSHDDPQTIAAVVGTLSAVMPWLFYFSARKFGLNRPMAALVLTLIVWNPGLIVPYFYFTPEGLALFLVGAATLATAVYFESKSGQSFLLAVLVWTVAALCHPLAAPLGIIALGVAWWFNSRKMDMLILGLVAAAILLVPNMMRTWGILGFPAPLGSSWVSALQHKAPGNAVQIEFTAKSGQVETQIFQANKIDKTAPLLVKIQQANGEADWAKANRALLITKESFVAGWGRNVVSGTTGAGEPNLFPADSFPAHALTVARGLWAPILIVTGLLALISVALGCRHPLAILALGIGFIFLTQTNRWVDGQYRKPAEPLILLSLTWLLVNRPWREMALVPERKVQRIPVI